MKSRIKFYPVITYFSIPHMHTEEHTPSQTAYQQGCSASLQEECYHDGELQLLG